MKLSIVIPVYQVEQYIVDCLKSIFDASSQDFEVIVVIDGSKDKSLDIVRSFTTVHKNIRLIEQQNQGLSSARMNGLKVAKGDYVWFVDSDDYLLPDAIRTVLSVISGTQDLDVIAFPLLWSYNNGESDHLDYTLLEPMYIGGRSLLKEKTIPVWAAPRYIIKRDLFKSEYLFFPKGITHEDEYFGRVLLYNADRVLIQDKPIYVYRQREGSITKTECSVSASNLVEVYKLLSHYSAQIEPEDKNWFKKDIVSLLLETYTRNINNIKTDSFQRFRQLSFSFISEEFRNSRHLFSFKDRCLGTVLLKCPGLYSKLVPRIVALNHQKKTI